MRSMRSMRSIREAEHKPAGRPGCHDGDSSYDSGADGVREADHPLGKGGDQPQVDGRLPFPGRLRTAPEPLACLWLEWCWWAQQPEG